MARKAIVTIVDTELDDVTAGPNAFTDTYYIEFEGQFAPHQMFNEDWVTFDGVTEFERLMVLPDKEETE